MARGQAAEVGAVRIAKNGYHYTKTSDRGWILTHWLTAETQLGRRLKEDEIVQFVDKSYKADPTNPKGVRVIKKRQTALRARKATLEDRIAQLQAELAEVNTLLRLKDE